MPKDKTEIRSLVLKVRVSPTEKKQLLKFLGKTTDRTLSNYLRKLGLQKPVTVRYRNESADDFLREMIDLKKQLNGIGNNFNQAVHKLHTLDHIPEFRYWIKEQQQLHKQVVQGIEQVRSRINQLYDQWLQK
ncbi:MAG: plasmid mobilization relaxosome protein MobC [Sediminibacterium sp.]